MLQVFKFMHLLPPKRTDPTSPPKRVLVVNITEFIGDTVMMMPFLDRLNAAIPEATVDVVTSAKMAYLLRQIPYLGTVDGIDTRGSRLPVWNTYQRLARIVRFVQTILHDRSYDMCLLPRWGADASMSFFLASMTGARRLIGHDPDDEVGVQNPFPCVQNLLTCISHGGAGLPEAIRELRLLESCGLVDRLDLAAEEKRPINSLLQIADLVSLTELKRKFGLNDAPYVVIAPGASHPARRWPPERFAETAISLGAHLRGQALVIGGMGDVAIGQLIEQQAGATARSLVGQTSLLENVALLRGAVALLANDSGPAHIGAGLGVPTIVLSACPLTSTREHANSPLRVRPVGPAVRVLQPAKHADGCDERCRASRAHCILGLTVESVLRHAKQLLAADG